MVLAKCVDAPERRLRRAKLREGEDFFRVMANAAPVMMWTSGVDKKRTFFNKSWLEFTGRSLQEEVGDGWTAGVHADDLQSCIDTYATKFDKREPFRCEYRLRRYDGACCWVHDSGVPLNSPDGTFTGYIGSCMDVTARKVAEGLLSTVGQRLIQAQEEERARISRELHDDISQRLTILAVDLHSLVRMLPNGSKEACRKSKRALAMVKNLARDVAGLSHRLHSSSLDHLGLGAAAAGLCREFSGPRMRIDFHCKAVPPKLPKDVGLCAFRVLQEALQNAAKHSGADAVHVTLIRTEKEIQLVVRDYGSGLDPFEAAKRTGLGLNSMQERVRAAHGHLVIKSKPQQGTTICARIPLEPEETIEPEARDLARERRWTP